MLDRKDSSAVHEEWSPQRPERQAGPHLDPDYSIEGHAFSFAGLGNRPGHVKNHPGSTVAEFVVVQEICLALRGRLARGVRANKESNTRFKLAAALLLVVSAGHHDALMAVSEIERKGCGNECKIVKVECAGGSLIGVWRLQLDAVGLLLSDLENEPIRFALSLAVHQTHGPSGGDSPQFIWRRGNKVKSSGVSSYGDDVSH